MNRLGALLLVGVVGCGSRTGLDVPEPSPEPTQQLPNPLPSTPKPEPSALPQSVKVAGCAYQCESGCTHPGIVVGTRLDTGQQIIPSNVLPGDLVPAGYDCGADVPVGIELSLEAQINSGFRFVRWGQTDVPCPCTDSPDPICIFVVRERVYCGAAYAKQ